MKTLITSGKRKRAVARAILRPGKGNLQINGIPIADMQPEIVRLKLMEPIILAKEGASTFDIAVKVSGGGIMGRAEAARLAIAKALVIATKDKKLEKIYLDYDRHLLVADVRRREARKPNRHGKARSKRQKSYR